MHVARAATVTTASTDRVITRRPDLRQFATGLLPRAAGAAVVLTVLGYRLGPTALVTFPLMIVVIGLGATWYLTRSRVTLDARALRYTRFGHTTTVSLEPGHRSVLALMKALQPVSKLIVRGADGRRLTLTTTWWRPADLVELAEALGAARPTAEQPLTPAQLERLAPELQSWPQRHPVVASLLAVVVIVGGAVTLALAGR
ncbi:hypothetical protein ACPEEZ_01850 [Frigoribacterium sp. 2-23]|uniref:hypothetical protein n=1 Tax=Frigoribacterium sp. 2-23 TaxID=3415006 RepID=UPI003C6F2FC5